MTPIHLWGAPKLSWDVPTQLMSGTQNGTGELQKSLAAGSGKWEISLHSRWYPRTWGLNLKWKAVTCKLSHQFPMNICCMPIRLWVRRGPKVQPSVNVTIPLVSEWMLLWFLGWGESDSPEKKEYMRLHADLFTKLGKWRLAPRPERTEYSQTAQGHALTWKSRSISAAHFGWTESFEIF